MSRIAQMTKLKNHAAENGANRAQLGRKVEEELADQMGQKEKMIKIIIQYNFYPCYNNLL